MPPAILVKPPRFLLRRWLEELIAAPCRIRGKFSFVLLNQSTVLFVQILDLNQCNFYKPNLGIEGVEQIRGVEWLERVFVVAERDGEDKGQRKGDGANGWDVGWPPFWICAAFCYDVPWPLHTRNS